MMNKEDYRNFLTNSIKSIKEAIEENNSQGLKELLEVIKVECKLFKELYILDNSTEGDEKNEEHS